ncbi:MAG: DUF2927 domain-containing protein [Devosia sp.]
MNPRIRHVVILALTLAVLLRGGGEISAAPFSDQELIRGFLGTVFGAERQSGTRDRAAAGQVKKFVGPIGYHIISTSRVDRVGTVRRFMSSLEAAVQNLSLYEERDPTYARLIIYLVDRAAYGRTIRTTVWDGVDTGFLEMNACSAVLAARPSGIERAHVYLVADEGFAGLSHCLVEEVAQSLGPANDDLSLADSIFNDESDLNAFGLFDWYILNMLYDSRVAPGMTMEEVRPLLPAIIQSVRASLPQVLGDDTAGLAHHSAYRR